MAVSSDRSRNPYGYKKGSYSLVFHTILKIETNPTAPIRLSVTRVPGPAEADMFRLGQTMLRAAPISSENARVSVP